MTFAPSQTTSEGMMTHRPHRPASNIDNTPPPTRITAPDVYRDKSPTDHGGADYISDHLWKASGNH